jgi:hypothetical protein
MAVDRRVLGRHERMIVRTSRSDRHCMYSGLSTRLVPDCRLSNNPDQWMIERDPRPARRRRYHHALPVKRHRSQMPSAKRSEDSIQARKKYNKERTTQSVGWKKGPSRE